MAFLSVHCVLGAWHTHENPHVISAVCGLQMNSSWYRVSKHLDGLWFLFQSPKTPPPFQPHLAKLLETQEQEIEDGRASKNFLQHLVTKLNEEREVKNAEILRMKVHDFFFQWALKIFSFLLAAADPHSKGQNFFRVFLPPLTPGSLLCCPGELPLSFSFFLKLFSTYSLSMKGSL